MSRSKKIKSKKIKVEKVEASELPKYKFSLKFGAEILEGVGETALDALRAIPRPHKITQLGYLTITHGEQRKEMSFTVQRLKRIFYPKGQPILIKQLIHGMK